MYLLKAKEANYGINFFTSIDEITPEILKEFTKNVKLSEHYIVVCTAYKTSLFNLASEIGNNKAASTIQVVPLIAKANDESIIGMKPIVAPSSIERGHHLFIPTASSMSSVVGYFKKFNDLRIECFQKRYSGNLDKDVNIIKGMLDIKTTNREEVIKDNETPIFVLEFKIVPECDIVSIVPKNNDINDPCLYIVKQKSN